MRRCIRHGLAESLGEVGMSARPVENSLQQPLAFLLLAPESLAQWQSFFLREVSQLDSSADIERGGAGVTDEIGRGCNAEQTKCQTAQLGVLGSAIVKLADAGEKFI